MHVYLAGACPQCRSTTMVVTSQDDAWGKDHAINCGVCGRRVIAAGLTGRGLQWHGSIDPEVCSNKLWDLEGGTSISRFGGGVDALTPTLSQRERGFVTHPLTMAERITADAGRAEPSPQPLWSTTPRETPRCVASRRVPSR